MNLLSLNSLAYSFPLLSTFWAMMWFFLWILWLILLFRIFVDLFRDDSLSGWAKAGWSIFVIVLPFLGVFVYLIARGRGMGDRELRSAQKQEESFRAYVQETAGQPSSKVDELAKLAELKSQGHITEEEFASAKAKLLAA